MKNVFIDAGSHTGQSIDLFMSTVNINKGNWEIHAFEPFPLFEKSYQNKSYVIFHPEAVWIEDGEIDLYYNPNNLESQGCSVMKGKTSGDLNKELPIKVKCIDFSLWLKSNFNKNDTILLRMDIEGAEYPVLRKMITDNTIGYLNKLSVEFHWHKNPGIINMKKEEHEEFISLLCSLVKLDIQGVCH